MKSCFQKDPTHRLTARELLVHPWITHRATNGPVATSHEDISTIVNQPAERHDSDSAELTIVHRTRSCDDVSATAHLTMEEPSSSSPVDARTDSSAECSECAKLQRALAEEKTKRQEILLTAINCISLKLF